MPTVVSVARMSPMTRSRWSRTSSPSMRSKSRRSRSRASSTSTVSGSSSRRSSTTSRDFAVVAVTFVAMAGVGVAEHAGLMAALIRKLVQVAPRRLIAFILIFVGVLSSVASDAGYLILIPLGAAAFLTLGRHPLAGMAAAFAGVGAIFGVNLLITPIDSMLTEITNEAIPGGIEPLTVTANYFFSVASTRGPGDCRHVRDRAPR